MSQPNEPEAETAASLGAAPSLARTMGLFSLVVYGIGDMVGSGIYGTIGKAAGQLGNAVWLGFVVSMVAAMLTGLSYASIASRYPKAAGAAFVTQHAFGWKFLSYLIGLAVAASGLTSMATSTNVFARVLSEFTGQSVQLLAVLFLLFMTFVNFWGIRESMWTNLLCTLVEVGGLLFVVVVGLRYWGSVDYFETPADPATGVSPGVQPLMLLSGAVLTFFAFVGFEDMLNVSEEVKNPERTMPWGIVFAVVGATLLYIAVAVTSVSVVPYQDLAEAKAPLEAITARAATWLPPWVFKAITLFAVANTVLINYIMGSRLLYGMARQGLVPRGLGKIHAGRRTPHRAILALLCIVMILIFIGTITELAGATGLLLLFSFMVVNAALLVLQFRKGEPRGHFEVPFVIPALGIVINAALIIARIIEEVRKQRAAEDASFFSGPIIAAILLVAIAALYLILKPAKIDESTLAAVEHEHDPGVR